MRVWVGICFVIALAVLAGCKKKKTTPGCDGDEDCQGGMTCVNKECVEPEEKPECSADTDCPDGKVCQAGKCQACSADSECGPGGQCLVGKCKRATACKSDDECADDEDCVDGFCQKPWAGGGGDTTCPLATVYFALDEAAIGPSERDRLDTNQACIEKTVGKTVMVIGHTDSSGTDEYNIALSERRGQTVADYLARLGTDPARLQVVPKGETEITGQGEDKDRRVEFMWR
jgi:peptidoglycan-associated lipoprotein